MTKRFRPNVSIWSKEDPPEFSRKRRKAKYFRAADPGRRIENSEKDKYMEFVKIFEHRSIGGFSAAARAVSAGVVFNRPAPGVFIR